MSLSRILLRKKSKKSIYRYKYYSSILYVDNAAWISILLYLIKYETNMFTCVKSAKK